MTDFKHKFPASNADTTALTITLASLAASTTLVVGRESTHVDNRTNLDLDHLLSGKTAIQSHATVGRIEVWGYAPISVASGTPAYGKTTGTDGAVTFDSRNQLLSSLVLLWSQATDASVARAYFMPPVSIREAFGEMPPYWGMFLTHSHGAALSSTSGDHAFHYHRIQKQF